ncbi:MAG: DUF3089 domain-containing protein [Chitinophagaceae bacterium]
MTKRIILLLLAGNFCFLLGCSPKYAQYASHYSFENKSGIPDYSSLNYWAAHPDKKDPSDSVSNSLLKYTIPDTVADVFFLHPTTLTSYEDTSWNADIDDTSLNTKTDYSSILYQASVFNECRVYAPRYRQAHIRAYFSPDTVSNKKAFDLAYEDITNSFQYYLDHYNNGRPIIIASHSQGSTHAQRLLKDFFENKPLKNKLVVAYVIGMYIPNTYFKDLKICSDSLQNGCVAGWRTFKNGYEPDFVIKENNSGWVTNPLTWATTNAYASYEINQGGVITNFSKLRKGITDAKIHDGVLWINRPHLPGSFLLRMKNFHVGDINLFYLNIRQNVRQRVNAYVKANNL